VATPQPFQHFTGVPDVFLCAAVDPWSQKRMVEFLKEAPKVVQFYREAPGAEDNALERELAPPDSMAVCSRNEHAVFGCGLVACPQLRSHGLAKRPKLDISRLPQICILRRSRGHNPPEDHAADPSLAHCPAQVPKAMNTDSGALERQSRK
jgi:hypothetical protein